MSSGKSVAKVVRMLDLLPARLPPWPERVPAIAAETATVFLGPGFVDSQLSAFKQLTVHFRDSAVGFVCISHFKKRESACAARFTISNHVDAQNLSILFEGRPQLGFGYLKTQVSYKNVFHRFLPLRQGEAFYWFLAERSPCPPAFEI